MNKPVKFSDPTVGTLEILIKGKNEYAFIHTATYLTKKEVEKIEQMGLWLIQAAQYLKRSELNSGSHRDI